MTPLQLLLDGARAAAEMLALLVVAPAAAAPAAPLDQAVQWHRWSGMTASPLDALRPANAVGAATAVATDCAPPVGRARLTVDEAIADASRDGDALIEAAFAARLPAAGSVARIALPLPLDGDAPRAVLVERDDAPLLAIVPHRRAAAATVVLRPVSGDARWVRLGAVDPRVALIIPLVGRHALDDLDQGAIEVELVSGAGTLWTTIVAERVDAHAVQAGTAD